ncbi:MAG: queuine tRNA-ribosyltransferase [Candidatus Woesearchaeota archaeon]|jgi:queuine tRNA-ribosyltransferase
MFSLLATDGRARAGNLMIGKKDIQTPFFMPVATKGAVKAMTPAQLKETGTTCLISNGFILSLKPGADTVASVGGIHKFMNWDGGSFTDSGGFQILLKEFFVKHDKEGKGIHFSNPFGGKKSLFTPTDSIHIQNKIGSDVAMAFDDVPGFGATRVQVEKSLIRTFAWAKESLQAHKESTCKTNPNQLLFGICQGNFFEDLRIQSANEISSLDFDGFAIGGVAIGEPAKDLFMAVDIQTKILPETKPRYIMGLGSPVELLEVIKMGGDCFDSIFPTQSARRGTLFSFDGPVRIKKKMYEDDKSPIEKGCPCYTCQNYSKLFVRHTLRLHEYVGYTLATIHNITFLQRLMLLAREHIVEGTYDEFLKDFKSRYEANITDKAYFHYHDKEHSEGSDTKPL